MRSAASNVAWGQAFHGGNRTGAAQVAADTDRLFPELKPYLEAVFDAADPGTEYVINRYLSALYREAAIFHSPETAAKP